MTSRKIQDRISEHKRKHIDYGSRQFNHKFYKAMRKYGFENFQFEILEECSDDELENREKFYIDLFESNTKGYNEAIGGAGKPLITEKQVLAFEVLYENGWLLRDIAEVFKVGRKVVGKKLKEKGINTNNNANRTFSVPIFGINKDTNEKIEFSSISDAARFVVDKKESCSNLISVISKISAVVGKENKSAYGFIWDKQ